MWLAVLHPHPQPVQAHHLGQVGGREGRRGGAGRAGPGQVGHQVPGAPRRQRRRVGGGHHQPRGPVGAVARQPGVRCPPHGGVAVAEAAHHARPAAGAAGPVPRHVPGGLHRGVRVGHRRPVPLLGLERQHERQPGRPQPLLERQAVPVGAVGHHRPERHPGRAGGRDELHGQLGLGPEGRVRRPPGQAPGRRVGRDVQGVVHPLVRPQAGHRHDPVVQLAHRAQVLPAGVGGVGPRLAVAGVVDDQHARGVGRRRRVGQQQLQPPRVDRRAVPGGLREEVLQLLGGRVLGPDHRLRPGEGGERLVPLPWQEQALQVDPEGPALGQRAEAGVELPGVRLQRPGGLRARLADRHGALLTRPLLPHAPRP
jgi:hypothetical protein